MINIELIRKFDENFWNEYCDKRHLEIKRIYAIKNLDEQVRKLQTNIQNVNSQINKLSAQFGALIKSKQEDVLNKLKQEVQNLKKESVDDNLEYEKLNKQLQNELLSLPNIPSSDVISGLDETNNVPQKYFKEPTKFDFVSKAHWDIMVEKDLVDLNAAQKINGTRFVVYKGLGARLIRALQWFTLDMNIKHGYTEILPPVIVDKTALYGTGQLPKFQEDLFQIKEYDKYLSPTAEVQLTNMYADSIIDANNLPYYFTANTSCFRSEAGGAGRDTRGVIRLHQFYKSELVKICTPQTVDEEHEKLTRDAESILEALDLPYRRILLCSGDMGFSATKTYDLEVWLPSYNNYKEISSCSKCGDFQARRMKMRAKDKDGKIFYPCTLNGSSLAIDRLFAAILENYQQADGSILIPVPLRKYFDGIEKI